MLHDGAAELLAQHVTTSRRFGSYSAQHTTLPPRELERSCPSYRRTPHLVRHSKEQLTSPTRRDTQARCGVAIGYCAARSCNPPGRGAIRATPPTPGARGPELNLAGS